MNKKTPWIVTVLLWLALALPLHAQDETTLELSLRRDFGYSLGSNVQGNFSFRVNGPDNLERVAFFIDDTEIGSDTEAPFGLKFKTDNYDLGTHTLSAIGYTSDGQEIRSNTITRNFVSAPSTRNDILWVILPLLILTLGGRLLTSWIANRGRKQGGKPVISGPLGGTICARCKRPFAIHLWSFRFVTVRGDRCPHCGKWQWVHRMPDNLLEAATAAVAGAAAAATEAAEVTDVEEQTAPADAEAKRRRQLEDSRFDS